MILAINMAMTIDGKVVRPDGKWYGLTSPEDKKQMDRYRVWADALIVGKNSIINDNPILKVRNVSGAISPRPIVLVRTGTLPKDRHIFEESSDHVPLVVCTKANEKEIKKNLENVAEIQILDAKEIDPRKVWGLLKRMGYKKILLEGGPKMNYSFLEAGLVTRIHITLVPYAIGKGNLVGLLNGEKELEGFDKKSWVLKESRTVGSEIFLTYDKEG